MRYFLAFCSLLSPQDSHGSSVASDCGGIRLNPLAASAAAGGGVGGSGGGHMGVGCVDALRMRESAARSVPDMPDATTDLDLEMPYRPLRQSIECSQESFRYWAEKKVL